MADRIVVFGATGYTGELIASRLVAQGVRPVLAGRSESRLSALAERLGGLEWVRADAMRQNTVFDLVGPGRRAGVHRRAVLEVGPAGGAGRRGRGVHLHRHDRRAGVHPAACSRSSDAPARRSGARLIPSMVYEFAAGSLAGALALGRGGRGCRARRRGLLRARRRAELAVGGHARVPGRDRAGRPLRVPGRRGARRCGPRSACARSRWRASRARRSRWAAPSTTRCRTRSLGLREVNVYTGWFGPLSRRAAGGVRGGLVRAARAAGAADDEVLGRAGRVARRRPGARERRRTCGPGSPPRPWTPPGTCSRR